MQDNNRNFLLAIILSVVVLIGWQAFVAVPRMQQEQAKKEQAAQAPGQPAVPAPGAPSTPGTGASVPSAPNTPAMQTRAEIVAGSPRVRIDTPALEGSIALKGARLDDLVLKKYRETVKPNSDPVVLFSPSGAPDAYYAEYGYVPSAGSTLRLPGPDTEWKPEGNATLTPDAPVTLAYDNGQGLLFRRTFAVDDNYMFSVRQEIENRSGQPVTLYPYGLISRHGLPQHEGQIILHEGLIGVLGAEGLQEIDYKDVLKDGGGKTINNVTGGWLGITDKYWAAVVIPPQGVTYQGRFGAIPGDNPRFQSDYLLAPISVAPGATEKVESNLFAGAKEVDVIDGYAARYNVPKLDLLIDWGWFYFLTKPLFYALDYFYRLVGNFGIAILIVTVIIKIILFPLANKSYVAMSKMKKLQPEMVRLKERYGDDKVRQQQALMELYKTEKVNPASGCLPILVQIPVFFALYKVLNISIEMRHAPFYGWIQDLSAPDPTTLFNLFGLIPWTPPHFLMIGIWPLIMGVTMFVQMRLNPAPPDPVQQKIFAWMPLFFTFILAPFPAGLVIYWAWNNTLSVIQQMVIMKRQGVDITLFENIGIKKPRTPSSSKT